MIDNTNWSSPKTNIIAAFLDLRRALQSGYNAVLIKARNEDCMYPIKVKYEDRDYRNYEFSSGQPSSINMIKANRNLTEFQKHLTLNYVTKYGTEEAMKKYYETGILSADNDKGMGRSHLIHVDDYIKFLENSKDFQRAKLYRRQYRAPEYVNDTSHLFDFYRYKHGSQFAIQTFKRKLWVVKLIDKDPKVKVPLAVKFLNVVMTPLKFIPKKSVLRMDTYKVITFRIGGVTSGYSVAIQIPKKFSFNN